MRTFAAARATTTLVLVGCLLLTGCGKSAPTSVAAQDPTTPATSAPAPTTAPATPTATPTKPKHTKKPTPTGGNGDSQHDNQPATDGGGICSDLDATEVGPVLGDTLTGTALPAGGCSFDPSNDGDPSASFVETSFASTPGGMEGAKTNATSSVEGNPVDLAGIGDAAFVVTGTAFGGPDIEGAGAVRVGDRLVNVSVTQSVGLSRAKVKALVVNLLKLAAGKLA